MTNELIQSLYKQSLTNTSNIASFNNANMYFDRNKFSRLIVKQCINIALNNSHRDDDMGAIIAKQIAANFDIE